MPETDATAAALAEMMAQRDVPLLPELEPWVEEGGMFGPMLRHPLVYDLTLTLSLPGMTNQRYETKVAALAEALEAEDWHRVVFLHERPYRFWAFQRYVEQDILETPHGECLRELLMDIWVDSENIHEHYPEWMDLLAHLADDPFTDDPDGFAALPDLIEVWRGGDEPGLSWSTSEETAVWFAKRFRQENPGPVWHGFVAKAAVAGYLTGRGESEIVVPDPEVVDLTD